MVFAFSVNFIYLFGHLVFYLFGPLDSLDQIGKIVFTNLNFTVQFCLKASLANFGEAGYRLELRRQGEYQSFVT